MSFKKVLLRNRDDRSLRSTAYSFNPGITNLQPQRSSSSITCSSKPDITDLQQQNPTEPYELFRKYCRDDLGCYDLGHSDTRQDDPQKHTALNAFLSQFPLDVLAAQHKQTIPSDLRVLGAEKIFHNIGGYDDIDGHNVIIWPQTSTFLLKALMKSLARGKLDPVIIYPEGNFRYNYYVEAFSGSKMKVLPVDHKTFKITPEMLEKKIKTAKESGQDPISFVLETPNNPWMQVYDKKELQEFAKIAVKHNIILVNDLYLLGTEQSDHKQCPVAEAIDDSFGAKQEQEAARNHLFTVMGLRRLYGERVRAGFAASHNTDLIKSVEREVRTAHMRWPELQKKEVEYTLSNSEWSELEELRRTLSEDREKAEKAIEGIDGMKIHVPAEAGPFITAGFSDNIIQEMKQLGLAKEENPDIIDPYKLGEYFSIAGLDEGGKNGVTLMPLGAMFTDIPGFRINANIYQDEFKGGVKAIERAICKIKEGISYDDISMKVKDIYNHIERLEDEKLRAKTENL